ncbi:hypothetical protein MM236_17060 [Belliella sp. DSM 107340]|uniref:Uncharacterized protein n=1 Tax=Belliella calami TaxID=2923436 RepID=A0ABS9UT89_9BACT|nr:hypothetical protein [Belliella calami]MCH7399709.1 hypothetical protein [Belliella calami]
MNDYKSEIEILLDSLDKSANSNTAWLHFNINSPSTFDINAFLLKQLQTGFFHFTLVESDINRGWEHYVSSFLSKNCKDNMIMLQRPGTTWNGRTELEINSISTDNAKELLVDLLTGERIHFSKSPLGTQLDKAEAEKLVDNFVKYIKTHKSRELTFYNIAPNFLWTTEDCFNSDNDNTRLGYFESNGRDLVLGVLSNDMEMNILELNILMTNGYC